MHYKERSDKEETMAEAGNEFFTIIMVARLNFHKKRRAGRPGRGRRWL